VKKYFLIAIIVALSSTFFVWRPSVIQDVKHTVGVARDNAELFVTEILPKKLVNPEPLKIFRSVNGTLTVSGIFAETNNERIRNGVAALSLDGTLSSVAAKKADDMFARQYFEHDSPDGKGAADLADAVGYDYIVIGENLALGNFKDDKDLVRAWMESPGHRANILNKRFSEIGIAAKKGTYEGKNVWLAVQTFAVPASLCPAPSPSLRVKIDASQIELKKIETELALKKDELESYRGNPSEYNKRAAEFNALVATHNALVEETKKSVALFNAEVRAFNTCIEG